MSYENEIKDLEERLVVYRRNVKRKPHLSARISKCERELEILKKAEAFDHIVSDETKVYKCTCGARYRSMDNYKEHLTNCFDS